MKISRERIQAFHDNEIAPGPDVKFSIAIPEGERWQFKRVTFASKSIGDGMSDGFRVDFGAAGDFEPLAVAHLMGNTKVINIDRIFVGDGVKKIRYIRENNSSVAKELFIFAEGFKRIGDFR